jgi:hypothetical protein
MSGAAAWKGRRQFRILRNRNCLDSDGRIGSRSKSLSDPLVLRTILLARSGTSEAGEWPRFFLKGGRAPVEPSAPAEPDA